ncbi:hypothetical protein HY311_00970 [Candidatus Nomurabacteria bacterium]|nr:hypothetical protein [Candidatus Nomurabacteria bacterium]
MDKTELQQNVALYYSKLTPKLQEIFSSMKWLETLQQISTKHDLTKAQQETLGTEMTLVLLGIIHLDEYKKNLELDLGLQKEFLDNILAEINESIIKTIRPELLNVFDANIRSEGNAGASFEEELDERFAKLPEEIKNYIKEAHYYETIYNIGSENGLTVEQIGLLETTTTSVILGTVPTDKFEDAIKSILKVPDGIAYTIVNSVNQRIIKEVRTKMGEPEEKHDTEEQKVSNANVLKTHGIEIIPEKKSIHPGASTTPQEGNNPMPVPEKLELSTPAKATPQEGNNTIHPALAQKMSIPVPSPVVKTDHSLPNITAPTPPSSKPLVDPYREVPE